MLGSLRVLLCALCAGSTLPQGLARQILSERGDDRDDSRHEIHDHIVSIDSGESANTRRQLMSSSKSSGGCTKSSLSNYQCMVTGVIQGVNVHYNAVKSGDSTAQMAVSMQGNGWVGLGFPSTPTQMVGAVAVIATSSAPNGVGVYNLNGKQPNQVVIRTGGNGRRLTQTMSAVDNSISNLATSTSNGMTVAEFERAIDSNFDPTSQFDIIVAMDSDPALGMHSAFGASSLALTDSPSQGASFVGGASASLDKERWAHGWLEVIGFGVLIPLGITMHSFKPVGAFWLRLHQAFNLTAIVSVLAGTILAFVTLGDALDSVSQASASAHKICGILSFALLLLMPFTGFIRPKPTKDNGKKGVLRVIWELAHRGVGYIAFLIALVAIFTGFYWIREFGSIQKLAWRNAYIGVLAGLVAIWLLAKLAACLPCCGRRESGAGKTGTPRTVSNGRSSSEASKTLTPSGGRATSMRASFERSDGAKDGARPVPRYAVV